MDAEGKSCLTVMQRLQRETCSLLTTGFKRLRARGPKAAVNRLFHDLFPGDGSRVRRPPYLTPPPHAGGEYDGPLIESYFESFFRGDEQLHHTYLPIPWTDYYCRFGFRPHWELQNFLEHVVVPDKQYFTIVQNARGILEKLPPNVLVFAAGGVGDAPIPLLKGNRPFRCRTERAFRVSFCGNPKTTASLDRHVRDRMSSLLRNEPGFHFSPPLPISQYYELMAESDFVLCPRGFGATSFRLYESLSFGSIPIYIWDETEWLPYRDELPWDDLILRVGFEEIESIPDRVNGMSGEELRRRRRCIEAHYDRYFTFDGVCRWIVDSLRRNQDRNQATPPHAPTADRKLAGQSSARSTPASASEAPRGTKRTIASEAKRRKRGAKRLAWMVAERKREIERRQEFAQGLRLANTTIRIRWFGRLGNNILQITNGIHVARLYRSRLVLTQPRDDGYRPALLGLRDLDFTEPGSEAVGDCQVALFRLPALDLVQEHPLDWEGRRCVLAEFVRPMLPHSLAEAAGGGDDDLVIHIRSGDIFRGIEIDTASDGTPAWKRPPRRRWVHAKYVQPPLAYYCRIIGSRSWRSVRIVAEDRVNPVIRALLAEYPFARHEPGSLEDDARVLLSARNLVIGYGTFALSWALTSRNLRRLYCTSLPTDVLGTLRDGDLEGVETHVFRLDDYLRPGEWRCTDKQLRRMLELPDSNVVAVSQAATAKWK